DPKKILPPPDQLVKMDVPDTFKMGQKITIPVRIYSNPKGGYVTAGHPIHLNFTPSRALGGEHANDQVLSDAVLTQAQVENAKNWRITFNAKTGGFSAVYTGRYPIAPGSYLGVIYVTGYLQAVKDGAYQLVLRATIVSDDDSNGNNNTSTHV